MYFISFRCQMSLVETYSRMLKSGVVTGHPCLVLCLSKKAFNLSLFNMMLAVGLSCKPFIMFRYVPSVTLSWEFLSWRGVEFVKLLFLIWEIILGFLSFILSMWCITFIDLHHVELDHVVWSFFLSLDSFVLMCLGEESFSLKF